MSFGEMKVTEAECGGTIGKQEEVVLSILTGLVKFKIQGSSLSLTAHDGDYLVYIAE